MAGAGAALLRSAASKIVRAPPRLLVQEGLQHHGRRLLGRGPSNRLSSYSTSGASTPPPTNHMARTLHELTTESFVKHEKNITDTKLMLEKGLNELKTNMEKKLIGQERSFDKAILELRYDLKKDADQQNLKHYVDLLKVKLEIKANDFKMEEMLKSQGHKFDLKIRDHDIRTLKGLGWFFGFSTVFLCPSLLFGSDSKKTSSSE